jgi:dolichol-phosphate mannosyltransferase
LREPGVDWDLECARDAGEVMPRVSLVVASADGEQLGRSTPETDLYAGALRAEGYEVDVLTGASVLAEVEELELELVGWGGEVRHGAGVAAAAVRGIAQAAGDVMVVVDPRMGYRREDVVAVARPLAGEGADPSLSMVVATRNLAGAGGGFLGGMRRVARGILCRVARLIFGTTDPFTGLLAFRGDIVPEAARFRPVGDLFSFELLAKLPGRRVDVPVAREQRRGWTRMGWNEIRQLKRVADHRYGNLSRFVQFCVVGASGMVVDLGMYAGFQEIFGRTVLREYSAPVVGGALSLAVSGVLAIFVALCWNFSFNRRLTFSDARHSSGILRQFSTYVLSNILAIMVSLSLRLGLPRVHPWFDAHKLAAAAVGVAAATGLSYTCSRFIVFRARREAGA